METSMEQLGASRNSTFHGIVGRMAPGRLGAQWVVEGCTTRLSVVACCPGLCWAVGRVKKSKWCMILWQDEMSVFSEER